MECPLSALTMDLFQLFIQSSRLLASLSAAILCSASLAGPRATQTEADILLESTPSMPARASHSVKYLWVEYCPDNTCDVIRTRKNANVDDFKILAVAYFFYFSPFEYLKEWKTDVEIRRVLNTKLADLGSRNACSALEGKELARCRLSELERRSGLQILFVRYDEGTRRSMSIPTNEALQ